MALLEFNDNGIYCPRADAYVDPWKPVDKAIITHGHADHARYGSRQYIATHAALPIIKHRLGGDIAISGRAYGETFMVNDVKCSFHPAGHIPGSAQLRLEYRGEVWVVSGDYKTGDDGFSEAFESVKCHSFITESTFGLPVYKWQEQREIFRDINHWWQGNQEQGKVSIIAGYSLGKAQRILSGIDASIGPIYTHGAVENINEVLRSQGYVLPETQFLDNEISKSALKSALVVCPPSALGSPWMKRFGAYSAAFCSGWMALRGARRRRAADRGFVLSDHADWAGLNEAVLNSGAENVYVTHGYKDIYARWLREKYGLNALPVETLYSDAEEDMTAS